MVLVNYGSSTSRVQRSSVYSTHSIHGPVHPLAWMFQTNIPRRKGQPLSNNPRKRNFFGLGEVMGVLTNPAETVRSLTESKRLLDEARREITENKERSQLRAKHTFSRLPGFFPRQAETRVIEKALEGEPSFTVLFGASSVGKTALLREVLCREAYHVLHFDLRIAGFADLASLYTSLSMQMEQYFNEIATGMEGYKDFEKESWGFKHDRLNVERRAQEMQPDLGQVRTSDIARLMELFQSSLLKYWQFEPKLEDEQDKANESISDQTHVNAPSGRSKWSLRGHKKSTISISMAPIPPSSENGGPETSEKPRLPKKMPVIFFDEAHKLPALIQSTEAMKCILDSMLVLTKQDRLCHVIHATSDPFYQTWLRQLNVMQHCKIITIGDCSKAETRAFYEERMLPRVPERLRESLSFESVYEAFGGKLAHINDFLTDYANSGGRLQIKQSSHFLQAHALLNLHVIHSSQLKAGDPKATPGEDLHPNLGAAGFKIYSPITHPHGPDDGASVPDFSAMQLLKVMSRLTEPGTTYLPYFMLCREMGVQAVDGMVKGRVLDLRWTETVDSRSIAGDGGTSPVSEAGEEFEVVGPKLIPTTPIMLHAMSEVVQEYEQDGTVSEYESLEDPDEY